MRYTGFRCVLFVLCAVCLRSAWTQDSAPSSHFVFDDQFPGDILIHDVRIPEDGLATYTYYEVLGWRGKAAGYAGIQAHPRAHNFIFSIWDHPDHAAPIRAVHQGPGTEVEGFGGEGTGLKSWNFELGWKTDEWHTLVSRCWPVDDHTYFAFWARQGDTGKWTHLVTMDVAVPHALFRGGTDAFIEDWASSGRETRTIHLRRGWKRKANGDWFPFGSGNYSVNAWDLDVGKRSHNFRTSWNGGVKSEPVKGPADLIEPARPKEAFYFMKSGGPPAGDRVDNPSRHSIDRRGSRIEFPLPVLKSFQASLMPDGSVRGTWSFEATSVPPFSTSMEIFATREDTVQALVTGRLAAAHERSSTVKPTERSLLRSARWARLTVRDIFDREIKSDFVKITSPE